MTTVKKSFSKTAWILALLLASLTAIAATITIRAGDAPYNQVPVAQGITVLHESELRVAALFGLSGAYRILHGPASLPRGTTFKVYYSDMSSEDATVACVGGTVCVIPVNGTQRRDDGTPIRGGGNGNGGSNGGSGGGTPPPGGGVVIVGPPTHEP